MLNPYLSQKHQNLAQNGLKMLNENAEE